MYRTSFTQSKNLPLKGANGISRNNIQAIHGKGQGHNNSNGTTTGNLQKPSFNRVVIDSQINSKNKAFLSS